MRVLARAPRAGSKDTHHVVRQDAVEALLLGCREALGQIHGRANLERHLAQPAVPIAGEGAVCAQRVERRDAAVPVDQLDAPRRTRHGHQHRTNSQRPHPRRTPHFFADPSRWCRSSRIDSKLCCHAVLSLSDERKIVCGARRRSTPVQLSARVRYHAPVSRASAPAPRLRRAGARRSSLPPDRASAAFRSTL